MGKLCAVGVGPGDPELLTLRAVRILRAADTIAGPAKDGQPGLAMEIARTAVPDTGCREWLPLRFPMRDGAQDRAHEEAAELLSRRLEQGKNVVFVTLGDPGLYSTFSYIAESVRKRGFETETVPGVPSFCAAAGALGLPLALGREPVLVMPSGEADLSFPGTIVVMKAGERLVQLKEKLAGSGREAWLVENCGMPGERVCRGIGSMPDKTGYFSLVIIR